MSRWRERPAIAARLDYHVMGGMRGSVPPSRAGPRQGRSSPEARKGNPSIVANVGREPVLAPGGGLGGDRLTDEIAGVQNRIRSGKKPFMRSRNPVLGESPDDSPVVRLGRPVAFRVTETGEGVTLLSRNWAQ